LKIFKKKWKYNLGKGNMTVNLTDDKVCKVRLGLVSLVLGVKQKMNANVFELKPKKCSNVTILKF
jgi:hypothetical protein